MFGRKDQFAFATSTLGEAARAGAGSELNKQRDCKEALHVDLRSARLAYFTCTTAVDKRDVRRGPPKCARRGAARPPPCSPRPVLDPVGGDQVDPVASPPITSPETSLATIQSAPLPSAWRWRCRRRRRSPPRSRSAGAGRSVLTSSSARMSRVGHELQLRRAVAFLQLGRGRLDPPVGDRGDQDGAVGGQGGHHRFAICSAVSTSIRSTPCGVASATGPATRVTRAPAAAAAAAMAKPCCPTSGWRSPAPDRSARGSGRR